MEYEYGDARDQLRVVSRPREATRGAHDRCRAKRESAAACLRIAKPGGHWPPLACYPGQGPVARRLLPMPFAQVTAREALRAGRAAYDCLLYTSDAADERSSVDL